MAVTPISRGQSSARESGLSTGDDKPAISSLEEDDTRLMGRICQGDQSAFAILVRKHSTKFYRIAYRFTGSRFEAEDMVQEAFLKLWAKPFLWESDREASFSTWFIRVIINLCLDYKKKKRPALLEDDSWVEDERSSQEEFLMQQEKQRWLASQIEALAPRQKMALNLCFYEGLSNQEAAQAMDIGIKALESLLIRAKTEIKNKLKLSKKGFV